MRIFESRRASFQTQSQRDCASKPRVASNELPWVNVPRRVQPQRGCGTLRCLSASPTFDHTPRRVQFTVWTEGRCGDCETGSERAGIGFRIQQSTFEKNFNNQPPTFSDLQDSTINPRETRCAVARYCRIDYEEDEVGGDPSASASPSQVRRQG